MSVIAVALQGSLRNRLRTAPHVSRPAVAADRMADLRAGLAPSARLAQLLEDERVRDLLSGVADHSPFLWRLVVADPDRCAGLIEDEPEHALDTIIAALRERADDPVTGVADAVPLLRRARQAVALLVALADLGGAWSLEAVTDALTRFADAALGAALTVLVREAVRTRTLRPGTVAATCGLAVLALGKGGAGELNYSSDVDLVVLFDPATAALADGIAAAPAFTRLTQALCRLLGEQTGDGFVLRVDLRLRPDPASTPVAVALPSALAYYEALGQTWERAAFIKARPMAGDVELGSAFLSDLLPFVWRKYFDYASVADIHAMKRQIHAVRGYADVGVVGHDVKLGRGGIREIEFFAQTQQLIFGGRDPALRCPGTLDALRALAAAGWVNDVAQDELGAAYRFLRTVEHRLQMIGDRQTQRLPTDGDELARFAAFLGFADPDAFGVTILEHLRRVQHHYARLFESETSGGAEEVGLVFSGTAQDPATLDTLSRLGFARPADAAELVRGWHFGRRPAVRSQRARAMLAELLPVLVRSFAATGDPDAALAGFDTVLGRMSAGTELLSLLRAHAGVRDLFAVILGSAPRMAAVVAQRPHVLDAAVDPALLTGAPEVVGARMATASQWGGTLEERLDRLRDTGQEEMFLAGVRTLAGVDDVVHSQAALTRIAEAAIRSALSWAAADLEATHGRCPDGACVVVGMGRLGSREMTATSDLDLILIYQGEADSDGVRPLDPTRYYARLTQRLVTFLTVQTRRGMLYDVDLRLRPSGRQGPVAVRLSSFRAYQLAEAQTWEHMALTRARVIAGDAALAERVRATVVQVLCQPRQGEVLQRAVVAMRERVAVAKGQGGLWDMKLTPGGLLDLDFIAQTLVLRHAVHCQDLLIGHPSKVFSEAERLRLLTPGSEADLQGAYWLQSTLGHVLRVIGPAPSGSGPLTTGVARRLCQAVGEPDLGRLEARLGVCRAAVLRRRDAILGR